MRNRINVEVTIGPSPTGCGNRMQVRNTHPYSNLYPVTFDCVLPNNYE